MGFRAVEYVIRRVDALPEVTAWARYVGSRIGWSVPDDDEWILRGRRAWLSMRCGISERRIGRPVGEPVEVGLVLEFDRVEELEPRAAPSSSAGFLF